MIRRISEKRLQRLGTKPYSTIGKRSKPRKRSRKKSERERIYGPPGYVEWIHEQPCIACGVVGFSEVAHVKSGGMGRKSDWTDTVPLCGYRGTSRIDYTLGCHAMLHAFGRPALEKRHDIDLEVAAISTQERWNSHQQESSI